LDLLEGKKLFNEVAQNPSRSLGRESMAT